MDDKSSCGISEAEAALYDRQIRLWGLDAQKRLRTSKFLLIGLSGLGAEVCKNVVLSGVEAVTIMDDKKVSEDDFCNNFFVRVDDLGKNRAEAAMPNIQVLNPMVKVTTDTTPLAEKDVEFFSQFHAICITCGKPDDLVKLNEICREKKIMFFCGDVMGFYGVSFSDLGDHEYVEEQERRILKVSGHIGQGDEPLSKRSKVEEKETVTVKKHLNFTSFKAALDVDWTKASAKTLKTTPDTFFIYKVILQFRQTTGRNLQRSNKEEDSKILQQLREDAIKSEGLTEKQLPENIHEYCFNELSPVCAITGGVLGQEVIKAFSKKDRPHNNFFLYNGVTCQGMVDTIGQ